MSSRWANAYSTLGVMLDPKVYTCPAEMQATPEYNRRRCFAPTNMRRILLITALAPVLALCTTLLWVYQKAEHERPNVKGPVVQVMVASHNLPVGTTLGAHDIQVISIPAADMPPGAPRRRSDVLGHTVIVPIAKGEFIVPNRLQH